MPPHLAPPLTAPRPPDHGVPVAVGGNASGIGAWVLSARRRKASPGSGMTNRRLPLLIGAHGGRLLTNGALERLQSALE